MGTRSRLSVKMRYFFLLLLFIQFFPLCVIPACAGTSDDRLLQELLWPGISNAHAGKRPAVGVALAGGGARAFTHTGFLQAMQYSSFPVDYVAGTSMGSVIGAYYASGKPIDDLWQLGGKLVKLGIKKDFFNIKLFSLIFSNKMMPAQNIQHIIENMFGGTNIEDLQKPFACVAVDVRTGEKVVFRSGPVSVAVRSSANFPGFFEPIAYKQRYLVDGGVVENIPVDVVKAMGADWIIASIDRIESDSMPSNVFAVLMQVIDVRGGMLASESLKKADFVVDPPVGSISTTAFERSLEAAEAGLSQTVKDMPEMKKAYIIKALPYVAGIDVIPDDSSAGKTVLSVERK